MLKISIYFSMWCQEISKGEAHDVGQRFLFLFLFFPWAMGDANKTELGICKLPLLGWQK